MEAFIAQKRRELGLTPAQLAQAVGAAEEEVARWEAGELPDSRYLLPLAEVLGVEVEEILRAATEKPHGASSAAESAGAAPASAAPPGEISGKVPAEEETSAAAPIKSAGLPAAAEEPSVPDERAAAGQADMSGEKSGKAATAEEKSAAVGTEAEQRAASPQQLRADGTPDWLSSMQPPDGERGHGRPRGDAEPDIRERRPVKEKLSTPVNGFTHGERVFGYIVCLLVLIAAVFVFVQRFVVGVELDQDNYARFLDIDVDGWTDVTITVTSSADIEDFSTVLEVEFYSGAQWDDKVRRTLTLSEDFLAAGGSVSGSVSMSEGGMYRFYTFRVISVGGKIV